MKFEFYYKTFNKKDEDFDYHYFYKKSKIKGYCKKINIINKLTTVLFSLSILLTCVFLILGFCISPYLLFALPLCVVAMICAFVFNDEGFYPQRYVEELNKLKLELYPDEVKFCKEQTKIAEEEKRLHEENKRNQLKEQCRKILKELDEDALCDIIQKINKGH